MDFNGGGNYFLCDLLQREFIFRTPRIRSVPSVVPSIFSHICDFEARKNIYKWSRKSNHFQENTSHKKLPREFPAAFEESLLLLKAHYSLHTCISGVLARSVATKHSHSCAVVAPALTDPDHDLRPTNGLQGGRPLISTFLCLVSPFPDLRATIHVFSISAALSYSSWLPLTYNLSPLT